MNQYLLMWFESTLQTWGSDSRFGRRNTLEFPTKSGVCGLICSALGAGGEQCELLSKLSSCKMTVISYCRTGQEQTGPQQTGQKHIGQKHGTAEYVKRDREILLRDYQTVGGGYDDEDPWQLLMIPKTADGKRAVGGGTKITHRYYLQDARFAVVFALPEELANEIANALQFPVWDIYLGRKNCVPTDFIYRGLFDSEQNALAEAKQIATGKSLMEDFGVIEGEHEGETFVLNDVPIQFGTHKKYRDRRVTVISNLSVLE